jgi:SPP1 gp7 family putative phage head morphogenesis protein
MELMGESKATKWLPHNFTTDLPLDNDSAARMLLFSAQSKISLKQYRESKIIKYVKIMASPNSCESCKKLNGNRYKIDEAQELPNPNCTYELGCRCLYSACID